MASSSFRTIQQPRLDVVPLAEKCAAIPTEEWLAYYSEVGY
jgi:hypothetical protein